MSSDTDEYQLQREANGEIHCIGADRTITILPDAATRAFYRNALKMKGAQHIRWLVCELDGVRLYVQGDHMVLTKQDLYP